MKRVLQLWSFSLIFLFSCAKERPVEFVQGQGHNLEDLSSYQGQTFEVVTGKPLYGKGALTSANDTKIDNKSTNPYFQNYDLVELTNPHHLLKDVPFRGEPGRKYKIMFEITRKYLILNKLVSEGKVASQEKNYASKITSGPHAGFYKVPLVGYSLALYNVDHVIKTSTGEDTHQLAQYGVTDVSDATHFKYDVKSRKVFEAISKSDVFPKDIFDGEWFYASTIISASTSKAASIGSNLTSDFEARSVSRIKFVPHNDRLRAVNLNVSDDIDQSDDINLKSAIELPVTWLDFQVKKEGSTAGIEEEKVDDDHAGALDWTKRPYMKIDFAKVKSSFARGARSNIEASFHDIQLADDYISFTLYYPLAEVKVKFAFLKAHEPIKGRVYKKNDIKTFGFFETYKDFIRSYKHHRQEDYEKLVLLNRFYPKINPQSGKKEIVYHFSHKTPDHLKDVGRTAIIEWDAAFQKAGSDIRVTLNETYDNGEPGKTVELGDIRYNIINILDTKDGAGLLGYGPSIADSLSGEIISATSNIYANPFRNGVMNDIRQYILSKLGKYDSSSVGASVVSDKEIPEGALSHLSEYFSLQDSLSQKNSLSPHNVTFQQLQTRGFTQTEIRQLLQTSTKLSMKDFIKSRVPLATAESQWSEPFENIIFGSEHKSPLYQYYRPNQEVDPKDHKYYLNEQDYQKIAQLGRTPKMSEILKIAELEHNFARNDYGDLIETGSVCSYETTRSDVHDDIEDSCGEEINQYIAELKAEALDKGHEVLYNEREQEILEKCSIKMVEKQVLATLIHEMGHNLGLRHNFVASADENNFLYGEKGRTVAETSSTMDYSTSYVRELPKPGPYDVAAIRYGYVGKVEVFDNSGNKDLKDVRKNMMTLDIEKSITENLVEYNKKKGTSEVLYPYKYCSDYDTNQRSWPVLAVFQTDPLCDKHDQGRNALQQVERKIAEYKSMLQTSGQRFDRNQGSSDTRLTFSAYDRYLIPIKMVYDHWRFLLSNLEGVGKKGAYLEDKSPADMAELMTKLEARDDYKTKYEPYRLAAKKAYDFLKKEAFQPVRYCLFKNQEEGKGILIKDFQKLRNDIYGETEKSVLNCSDPLIANRFQEGKWVYDRTVGALHDDLKHNLKAGHVDYNLIDEAGSELRRTFAFLTLTSRVPNLRHLRDTPDGTVFLPSFMDNPTYRQEIHGLLMNRILAGEAGESFGFPCIYKNEDPTKQPIAADFKQLQTQILKSTGKTVHRCSDELAANSFISEKYVHAPELETKVPYFAREKNLMTSLYLMFVGSLRIPDRTDVNSRRISIYRPNRTQQPGNPANGFLSYLLNGQVYLTAHQERNPIAYILLSKMSELNDNRELFEGYTNQQLAIPSAEQLEGFMGQLPMVSLEELKKMKMKEFIQTQNLALNLILSLPAPIRNYLTRSFLAPELRFYQTYSQLDLDSLKEEDLNMTAFAYMTKKMDLAEEDLDFTKDHYEARVKTYAQQTQRDFATIQAYQEKADEFNAQLDILTSAVSQVR